MKLRKFLISGLLLLLTVSAFADRTSKTGGTTELADGQKKSAVIQLNEDFGIPSRTFSFRVPKNAYAVEISIADAEADLDLFIQQGSKPEDFTFADYASEQELYNESVFISRQSDLPLETGVYYCTVAYQYDYMPLIDGRKSEQINFSIEYRIVSADTSISLKPGTPANLVLEPENGMFASAYVNVPSGTDVFRIDVFNTNADVDIYTALRNPAKTRNEALYAAESMLGSESLLIKGYSGDKLVSGKYYVSFIDQLAKEIPQQLSVLVTFSEDTPELLSELPVLPEPEDSFDSALLSTVEIISDNGKGSGCIVSREGHIITNWHVIKGADGKPSEDVYVAMSLTNYYPPSELFKAEVVEYNEELDLALLRVNAGRYDQPLPVYYDFPYFTLGNSSKLRIGQPVSVIGYPEVGGTGSRTSVTFTSGIVSGFELADGCTVIKTDALINSGNSGGAVVDAYFELLGFPGYIMDINNDKMGYIYPVSCIPSNWLKIIAEGNE